MGDNKYFVVFKKHYASKASGNLTHVREFKSKEDTLKFLASNILTVAGNGNKNYEEGNLGELHAIYKLDLANGDIVDFELKMNDKYEIKLEEN
ncbi:hypothetical protein D3C79_613710 [compost metagenome]